MAASSERRWVLRYGTRLHGPSVPTYWRDGEVPWTHSLGEAAHFASEDAARDAGGPALRPVPVRPRRAAPAVNVGDEQMTAESFALRLMEYAVESEPSVAVKRIAAAVSRLVFDANLTRLQKRMLGLAVRLGVPESPSWSPEQVAAFNAFRPTPEQTAGMSDWGKAFEGAGETRPKAATGSAVDAIFGAFVPEALARWRAVPEIDRQFVRGLLGFGAYNESHIDAEHAALAVLAWAGGEEAGR